MVTRDLLTRRLCRITWRIGGFPNRDLQEAISTSGEWRCWREIKLNGKSAIDDRDRVVCDRRPLLCPGGQSVKQRKRHLIRAIRRIWAVGQAALVCKDAGLSKCCGSECNYDTK